jgi:arsenate reductase (thioredoxin)
MTARRPPRILVLCTGNRCRSQMAEGWLRYFAGRKAEIHSAGTQPKGVHPLAVKVMAEAGVDIAGQRSKHVDEFARQPMDLVVTVCDAAKEACPVYPGASATAGGTPTPPQSTPGVGANPGAGTRRLHHSFADPDRPDLPEKDRLELFRRTRNEIRDWAWELVVSEV